MANNLTKDELIHKVITHALLDPKSGQNKTSVDGLLYYIKRAGVKDITKGDIIKHAKTMTGITVQGGTLIADVKEDLGLSFGSRGGGMNTNSLQNYNHFDVDQNEDWEDDYEKTELELRMGVTEATISGMQIKMLGKKLLNKINIGTKFITTNDTYTVTGYGPKANAFQEYEVKDKSGKDKKVKLTVMYVPKFEVSDNPRLGSYREEQLNSITEGKLNEAAMTASKMAKIFQKKADWGDMGDHVYVKGNNLVVIDTFYYGEQKAIEDLSRAWKPGGHSYDYFRKTYGIDMKIVDTFSEYKATGRHKKLTNDGIVGIVLQISGGQDKPITENKMLKESRSSIMYAVQTALKNAGYSMKQNEFKVGIKNISGYGSKISLNGEMLGYDDSIDNMVTKFTKYIKQDPKKYGLNEMKTNEVFNGTPNKNDGADILRWIKSDPTLTWDSIKKGKFKARDIAKMMSDDVGRPVKPEWVKGALELVGLNLQESVNEATKKSVNEKADPEKFRKGFERGDVIVNDDNSRYVIVAQRGKQFIVGDNGERREFNKGKVGKKNLKGNLSLKDVLGESVNEAGDFAGWIAGFNGKKVEIKKGEAKDLWGAKQLAANQLKVPKSKMGLLWIKPAVDESVNEASFDSLVKKASMAYKGAKATGGGYGPFVKIRSNAWENPKTKRIVHDKELISRIGTFSDFKITEGVNEASKKSVTAIANALAKVANEMKTGAAKYSDAKAKGDAKTMKSQLEYLKKLTAQKKELERGLDAAVMDLDKDAELVANEQVLRAQVRNMVRESLITEGGWQFAVEDVFFVWDEIMDDDRKGISQGITKHNGKTATQISFEYNNKSKYYAFMKKAIQQMKKDNVKYNWMDQELYIYH